MVPKFLLIDDDSDDRELFAEALQEIDPRITCYTAPGGRKAIEYLANKQISIPDIIFLDVNMPGISGWQCLTLLKHGEDCKHVPVIMYSTSTHPEDLEKAERNGALCFLTKPARFTELKQSLELVIHHLTTNTLSSLVLDSPLFRTTSGH